MAILLVLSLHSIIVGLYSHQQIREVVNSFVTKKNQKVYKFTYKIRGDIYNWFNLNVKVPKQSRPFITPKKLIHEWEANKDKRQKSNLRERCKDSFGTVDSLGFSLE